MPELKNGSDTKYRERKGNHDGKWTHKTKEGREAATTTMSIEKMYAMPTFFVSLLIGKKRK